MAALVAAGGRIETVAGRSRVNGRIEPLAPLEFFDELHKIFDLLNPAIMIEKIPVPSLGILAERQCHVGHGSLDSLDTINQP